MARVTLETHTEGGPALISWACRSHAHQNDIAEDCDPRVERWPEMPGVAAMFGPPLLPPVVPEPGAAWAADPAVRRAATGVVQRLRLPVRPEPGLADALERAGCDAGRVVRALRSGTSWPCGMCDVVHWLAGTPGR